MSKKLYPLLLEGVYKDYLWGGDTLKNEFNKKSNLNIIAESWELTFREEGVSKIRNGSFKGKNIEDFINSLKKENVNVIGNKYNDDKFPLLIKFIDAKDSLSVQVHPSDEYALKNEGDFGKTEMWYVVKAEKDAFLYVGFNQSINKEEFDKRVKDNTLTDVLNKINVKEGDCFFISPGTVHAIGKGCLICEVQQNSNLTYRIYDYNRVGADGKTRPLHVDKALNVIDFKEFDKNIQKSLAAKNMISSLFECEYFNTFLVNINNDEADFYSESNTFTCFNCLDGSGVIEVLNDEKLSDDEKIINIKKGDSVFIPAGMKDYIVRGNLKLIMSQID